MNKLFALLCTLMLFIFCIQPCLCQQATTGAYSSLEGRAVSLKILQAKLRESNQSSSLPRNLYEFCGLKKIIGYVVDDQNKDILIIGKHNSTSPPILVDDFVVALRNAWMIYATNSGNRKIYEAPGCSIDPLPATMKQLEDVSRQMDQNHSESQTEQCIDKWGKICRSPQKVRVMGIPFHTHFGKVMVEADYSMKKIVDGTDHLNIFWFNSLLEREMEAAKSLLIKGNTNAPEIAPLNRFWFCPKDTSFLEDDGIVVIDRCDIKLLSEEEYVTSRNTIQGKGRANSIAKKFVQDFTTCYDEIAAQRPIFKQLSNLFRLVALAKAIRFKAPHQSIGLSLDYLLYQHPISNAHVPRTLPGRFEVKRYERQVSQQDGQKTFKLWLPSCGGVSIAMSVDQSNLHKDTTGEVEKLKVNALEAAKPGNQLICNLTGSNKKKYYAYILLDNDAAGDNGHMAIQLGNEKHKHTYWSFNKPGARRKISNVDLNDIDRVERRYNTAYKIEISNNQYDMMQKAAAKKYKKKYHWRKYNCADFVNEVLTEGKVETGGRNVQPLTLYRQIKEKNKNGQEIILLHDANKKPPKKREVIWTP